MSGVNKVIIIGHLGADPELRTVSNGNTVARLNVATSENWTDREGQRHEKTEWHRIVVWGKQAEICGKFLTKGRQVYVEGRLQTRSWEDQNNQKKYTTEVIANNVQFLGAQQSSEATGSNIYSSQREDKRKSYTGSNEQSVSGASSSSSSNRSQTTTTPQDGSGGMYGSNRTSKSETDPGSATSSFDKNEEIPF